MILGMSTATYTLLHVLISLVAIGSGLVVMYGFVTGKRLDALIYPGFPHGMPTTNADQINAGLLAFIAKSQQKAA